MSASIGTTAAKSEQQNANKPQQNVPPVGGRYQYVLLAVLSATFGFVLFDRMIINALMPFIRDDLGLNNAEVGLVGGMSALTWAVAALIMGWLTDQIDRRKPVLIIAIILFSVFSALSGFVGGIASLLLLRGLLGASEGGTLPVVQSLLFHSTEEKKRGLFVGIVQGSAPGLLGGILSPLIGVWLAEAFGWRTAFFVTVIPGLILAAVVLFIVKELRQRDVRAAEAAQGTSSMLAPEAVKVPLRSVLTKRNVLLCLPIGLFYQAWFTLTQIFTPTFLIENRGFEATEMAFIMSGVGVAWLVWGAVIPALSDRIGRRPAFVVFTLIAALSPIIIMFMDGAMPLFLALAATYTGLGCMVLFMTVIPGESVDKIAVGTVVGFVMGFSEITGGFLMPIIAGGVADAVGLQSVMWIATGAAVVAALFALFLKETAPRRVTALEAQKLRG